jgi:hypothetical protein
MFCDEITNIDMHKPLIPFCGTLKSYEDRKEVWPYFSKSNSSIQTNIFSDTFICKYFECTWSISITVQHLEMPDNILKWISESVSETQWLVTVSTNGWSILMWA